VAQMGRYLYCYLDKPVVKRTDFNPEGIILRTPKTCHALHHNKNYKTAHQISQIFGIGKNEFLDINITFKFIRNFYLTKEDSLPNI
jgi:hypothetical protein